MKGMKNILMIGAHYDDVELGCGGTAAKLAEEGKNVYKLTLTDNATDFKQMNIHVDADASIHESASSCQILGIREITEFKPVPCNHLFYSTELMQRVESVIFDYDIDTVFMHYYDDMNQDHVEASRICKTASRHCRNVLMYHSNGYILMQQLNPLVFVDISPQIDKKLKALACYEGDHNRFNKLFDTVIQRNQIWGYANKVNYAEGFRPVKIML